MQEYRKHEHWNWFQQKYRKTNDIVILNIKKLLVEKIKLKKKHELDLIELQKS